MDERNNEIITENNIEISTEDTYESPFKKWKLSEKDRLLRVKVAKEDKNKNLLVDRMETIILSKLKNFKVTEDLENLRFIVDMLEQHFTNTLMTFDYLFEGIDFNEVTRFHRHRLCEFVESIDYEDLDTLSQECKFHDRFRVLTSQSIYQSVIDNLDLSRNMKYLYRQDDEGATEPFGVSHGSLVYSETITMSAIKKYKETKDIEVRNYIINNMMDEISLISGAFADVFPEVALDDLIVEGAIAVMEYIDKLNCKGMDWEKFVTRESRKCYFVKKLKRVATKAIFLICAEERFHHE